MDTAAATLLPPAAREDYFRRVQALRAELSRLRSSDPPAGPGPAPRRELP